MQWGQGDARKWGVIVNGYGVWEAMRKWGVIVNGYGVWEAIMKMF